MIPQGPPYAAQELLAEPAAASAPHGSSGQIWGQRKWSKQIYQQNFRTYLVDFSRYIMINILNGYCHSSIYLSAEVHN